MHAVVTNATAAPENLSPIGDIPTPLNRPTTVLTPRGVVAAQIVRLSYALAELQTDDRAWCLALLADEIRPLIADLANG